MQGSFCLHSGVGGLIFFSLIRMIIAKTMMEETDDPKTTYGHFSVVVNILLSIINSKVVVHYLFSYIRIRGWVHGK